MGDYERRAEADERRRPARDSFVEDQTNPRRIAILEAMRATRTAEGPISTTFEQALLSQGYEIRPAGKAAEITLHAGKVAQDGRLVASFFWPAELGELAIPTTWRLGAVDR